jgi:hypothetical protein
MGKDSYIDRYVVPRSGFLFDSINGGFARLHIVPLYRGRKAVEFSCSALLLLGVGVSLGVRVSYERQLNFYVAISALMLLTLLCRAS